jgi:transposase
MGGRPPLDDRRVLKGIVFVLRTGIPWTSLPKAMGCGSGMTCWRLLRDWQAAGVWTRLHQILLDRLGRANAVDFSRCSLDSASFPAKRGRVRRPEPDRPREARNQAPRARGSERHPARASAQPSEHPRHAVPPVRQCAGRPRRRPVKLHADKGYDYDHCRRSARQRNNQPRIARRGVDSGERLGRHRWVVERTLAWFRALSPPHRPLRAPSRHPARLPPARRRPDLPAVRRAVVLLRAFNRPW